MNRIQNYIYTLVTAVAFIYGSLLCVQHRECLSQASGDAFFFFGVGIAVILFNYALVNVLIRLLHPGGSLLHGLAFSSCIILLIYDGVALIYANPYIAAENFFDKKNIMFYFGVYLVVFGISFLKFILKK